MNTHRVTSICCMRADCPDPDCPGAQMARLYQAEGGAQIDTERTAHRYEPAPRVRHSLTFILIAAAVAVSVVTAFSF